MVVVEQEVGLAGQVDRPDPLVIAPGSSDFQQVSWFVQINLKKIIRFFRSFSASWNCMVCICSSILCNVSSMMQKEWRPRRVSHKIHKNEKPQVIPIKVLGADARSP